MSPWANRHVVPARSFSVFGRTHCTLGWSAETVFQSRVRLHKMRNTESPQTLAKATSLLLPSHSPISDLVIRSKTISQPAPTPPQDPPPPSTRATPTPVSTFPTTPPSAQPSTINDISTSRPPDLLTRLHIAPFRLGIVQGQEHVMCHTEMLPRGMRESLSRWSEKKRWIGFVLA